MRKYLLFGVFLLLFLASCVAQERDGGYVQLFTQDPDAPAMVYIQNEYLRLEFLTATAEIVVTELASGREWRSTPEGAATCQESAAIERFQMQSLLMMEYENRAGSFWREDAYRFSVRLGNFTQAIVDGGIEVYFTIGDIPETFHVPYAIHGERLEALTDGMPRMDWLQVMTVFNETVNEYGYTVFELQEDLPSHMLATVEGILYRAGYTYEDWVADMTYFGIATVIDLASFNVTMRFELDRNSMVVTIPFDDISYHPTFMPTRLTVMPYFGAARATDEGYLFVPDGSGALIYFDSGRYNQMTFETQMFGWDEAIMRDVLIHEHRSPYPVFGVYKNGGTFAAIIEEGSAYASIRAEAAGMRAPFNRVHPLFRLLHGTPLDVAGRGTSLYMHEWELPRGESIVIRYTFTQQPGYVGMAHAYRAFLQERYPWLNNRVEQPVHAMVEILGAARTPQHVMGFPVNRPYPLTTFAQAADMINTMSGLGWENLHIKMRGAHNQSIDHRVPTSLNLISQLGNRRAFNNLLDTAAERGHTFYLEGDFVFMRGNTLFDGFNLNRDAARQANRQRLEHHGFSMVYFGPLGAGSIMADPVVLARPAFTNQLIRNFVNEAAGAGVDNMAFRSFAATLSGDFHEDRHVSREAAMRMRSDLLTDLRAGGTGIWLNYGFSYAMPFADIITGMPLTDQNFGITDIDVPFYQIALHGLIPFAGRPLNLAEDHSHHLLKSIESGASLFFSFMNVPTADLQVTRYRRYFANEFGRWAGVADDLYQRHVANFGHLYNQFITDHQVLCRSGVSLTVYEDGTRVYVNTTTADFTTDTGVFVPARRYAVFKGV